FLLCRPPVEGRWLATDGGRGSGLVNGGHPVLRWGNHLVLRWGNHLVLRWGNHLVLLHRRSGRRRHGCGGGRRRWCWCWGWRRRWRGSRRGSRRGRGTDADAGAAGNRAIGLVGDRQGLAAGLDQSQAEGVLPLIAALERVINRAAVRARQVDGADI